MENKQKKKGGTINVILIILIVIAAGVFCVAGYKVYTIMQSYGEAKQTYNAIEDLFDKKPSGSVVQETADETEETAETTTAPADPFDADVPFEYDFDKLKAMYPDAIGWIYLKDYISYPIMQASKENDEYYLTHLADGTWNGAGTLFVDSNFDGMNGSYSIIYGHNMQDRSMFGNLHQYHSEEFYREHSKMHVFIGKDHYVYDVIGALTASTNGYIYYNSLDADDAYKTFLSNVWEDSEYHMYIPEGLNNKDNPIITLSTCTNDLSNYYRWVVILARDHKVE